MQDFFEALAFAYAQISKRYVMRYIIGIGVVVTLFWSIVGFVFWDDIIAISSSLIDLVPFAFIRSNGAIFISTFLYMQLVLLSFAIVHAFVMNLYMNSTKERQNGFITLAIVTGSALFWAVVWFFNAKEIHLQLSKVLTWLPFETVEVAIAYLLGFYLLYNMIIISMTIAASLFSGDFLLRIKEEEFPYDTLYENEINVLKYTLLTFNMTSHPD